MTGRGSNLDSLANLIFAARHTSCLGFISSEIDRNQSINCVEFEFF